jgi:hypothetical protein
MSSVIARELLHERFTGDGIVNTAVRRYRYVVDVRPEDGPVFRAKLEAKISDAHFRPDPDVGDNVPVQFKEGHPDSVEFDLKGSRYDIKVQHAERDAKRSAERAGDAESVRRAMEAGPGAPPG